jgi:hypothetical protein
VELVHSWVIGAGQFERQLVSEEARAAGLSGPLGPLDAVPEAINRVARALDHVGVISGPPLLDPDLAEAKESFKRIRDEAAGRPIVMHFAGHGVVRNDELYLALSGTDLDDLPETALSARDLIVRIENSTQTGPALLILDVCSAGQALSTQIAQQIHASERKVWVIGACSAQETTHAARFSHATAAVLRRLSSGLLDLSPELPHVPIETLAAEIHRELARNVGAAGLLPQTVVRTPRQEAVVDIPPFFRNEGYRTDPAARHRGRVNDLLWRFAVEGDPGLDPVHFVTRAAGTQAADSCLFRGRKSQRARITDWLNNTQGSEPRLLVVTGSPGSGKSALLGVTACLTHPQLAPVAGPVVTRITDHRPRPRARVMAVHVRQCTTSQVVKSLQNQLDWDPSSHNVASVKAETSGDLDALFKRIAETGSTVLIIDALDEAADPEELLHTLLLPLAGIRTSLDGPMVPGCRVVIGTRPWWERFPGLHAAANAPGSLLDLDAVPRPEVIDDLTGYLTDLLWSDDRYDEGHAHEVAKQLAKSNEHGGFLLAGLFADYLMHLPGTEPLNPDQAAERVPVGLAKMLELHLETLANVGLRS